VAKKKTTKKTAGKKATTRKTATNKPAARQVVVKKTAAKKSTAKKVGTPKTTAKKRISKKKRPTMKKAGTTTPEVTTWNARTIRTLINRLLKKKTLRYEKEGRKYRYFPAVSRERCVREERRSFVQRIYGGTVTPMLAAFIEDAELSATEIRELRERLDRKEGK